MQAVKGSSPTGHPFWEFSHNILLVLGKYSPYLPRILKVKLDSQIL